MFLFHFLETSQMKEPFLNQGFKGLSVAYLYPWNFQPQMYPANDTEPNKKGDLREISPLDRESKLDHGHITLNHDLSNTAKIVNTLIKLKNSVSEKTRRAKRISKRFHDQGFDERLQRLF